MKWNDGSLIANKNSLSIIEEEWDVVLPTSFSKIISHNNNGYSDLPVFDTDKNQRMFSGFLNFDIGTKYDVLNTYQDIKDRLPRKVFPFGFDPFGNFLCFNYNEKKTNPKIVFWHHEYYIKDENENYDIELVENSFEEFIGKLYKIDKEPMETDKEKEDFWNKLINDRKREEGLL